MKNVLIQERNLSYVSYPKKSIICVINEDDKVVDLETFLAGARAEVEKNTNYKTVDGKIIDLSMVARHKLSPKEILLSLSATVSTISPLMKQCRYYETNKSVDCFFEWVEQMIPALMEATFKEKEVVGYNRALVELEGKLFSEINHIENSYMCDLYESMLSEVRGRTGFHNILDPEILSGIYWKFRGPFANMLALFEEFKTKFSDPHDSEEFPFDTFSDNDDDICAIFDKGYEPLEDRILEALDDFDELYVCLCNAVRMTPTDDVLDLITSGYENIERD